MVAGAGLHAARVGDRAAEAERRPCLDRAWRRRRERATTFNAPSASSRSCSPRAGTITCTAKGTTGCTTARRSGSSRRIRRSLATAFTPPSCAAIVRRSSASLRRGPKPPASAAAPRGWTPILYLAYTRFTHQPTIDNALAIARLLLDHGADPNDFYMAGDARYTVLAGAAGEGEQDSPRQPYAAALFELLLERGAEPFDIQVLYNTHFSGDILWWLELVYKHTIDTPRGAAWKDPDWPMLDMGGIRIGRAISARDCGQEAQSAARRVGCWRRGANPECGARARPALSQAQPVRARRCSNIFPRSPSCWRATARTRSTPVLDEHEQFVEACFRLDRDDARGRCSRIPNTWQSPAAMFEAARRDRPDVLALLLDLGFPLEIQDQTGKRALHEAAAHQRAPCGGVPRRTRSEVDPRESSYNGTPIGWAAHGDKTEMVELSQPAQPRHLDALLQRLRRPRARDPGRESEPAHSSLTTRAITPLWWLPDDEAKAMQIVELLLAAGADPSAKNKDGRTAADWARRRGMRDVAARLESAANLRRP